MGQVADKNTVGVYHNTAVIHTNDGGNISAQTTAAGTTFAPFADTPASSVTVSNNTGTAIEVQQDGAGVAFPIPSGQMFTFRGIANANQLAVRRVDQAITQVTVAARWEK